MALRRKTIAAFESAPFHPGLALSLWIEFQQSRADKLHLLLEVAHFFWQADVFGGVLQGLSCVAQVLRKFRQFVPVLQDRRHGSIPSYFVDNNRSIITPMPLQL